MPDVHSSGGRFSSCREAVARKLYTTGECGLVLPSNNRGESQPLRGAMCALASWHICMQLSSLSWTCIRRRPDRAPGPHVLTRHPIRGVSLLIQQLGIAESSVHTAACRAAWRHCLDRPWWWQPKHASRRKCISRHRQCSFFAVNLCNLWESADSLPAVATATYRQAVLQSADWCPAGQPH